MDKSGGSREEKDDDHLGNRRKRNAGSLGFKNEEGSDKESSDEVPQSLDQMEVVEDVTGGLGGMFGNNDRVGENLNAEFIASQMDIRGPVGLVGGQFGNELGQSSDNSDVWNQRKRPRGQNTGNIGNSSHGTALGQRNVLGQSASGTQPVLHSKSLNVLGQSASGAQPVLHSESSNVFGQGQGQGTGGTRSVLRSESSSRNVYGRGQQGMHSQSQSVTPTATQYQHGRFTVTHEQPSAISGVSRPLAQSGTGFYMPRTVQEHNMRVRSDPDIASGNMSHTFQRGRFTVTTYAPPSGTWFIMPQAVQEHNMRVWFDPDIARGYMSRLGGPLAQYGTGFYMPRGVREHNLRIRSDANMVHANMFRQGTPQMGQQRGFFGTPMNPFFPTFASQNVGLPVTRPPVHMGMLPNANMAAEARDREEDVSDQGSSSEDP